MKAFYIPTNNAQLFTQIAGKGDPLIVIHGGPGMSQDYLLPYLEKLQENAFVIFYDQRGSGRSLGDINEKNLTIDTFIEDIESLRNYFGFDKISLLGHSFGGFLAMSYAIHHPLTTRKLILLNTTPASSEEFLLFRDEWEKRMKPDRERFDAIISSEAFKEGDPEAVESYYRINFERYCYDPGTVDRLHLRQSRESALRGREVYRHIFQKTIYGSSYDLHPALKKLKMPTLIIHGACDPIVPSAIESIPRNIEGSEYHLIANCGHFPYVETPDEFSRILTPFLTSKERHP